MGDMHAWVSSLLPDLPPSLPPGQTSSSYAFVNTLLGTQLVCRCGRLHRHGHCLQP